MITTLLLPLLHVAAAVTAAIYMLFACCGPAKSRLSNPESADQLGTGLDAPPHSRHITSCERPNINNDIREKIEEERKALERRAKRKSELKKREEERESARKKKKEEEKEKRKGSPKVRKSKSPDEKDTSKDTTKDTKEKLSESRKSESKKIELKEEDKAGGSGNQEEKSDPKDKKKEKGKKETEEKEEKKEEKEGGADESRKGSKEVQPVQKLQQLLDESQKKKDSGEKFGTTETMLSRERADEVDSLKRKLKRRQIGSGDKGTLASAETQVESEKPKRDRKETPPARSPKPGKKKFMDRRKEQEVRDWNARIAGGQVFRARKDDETIDEVNVDWNS